MNKKLRILNLEDSETDTELIQAMLEEEGIACEITRVETEDDYIAALTGFYFDLLLVDYKLPSFDGLSALTIAKEKCPDVPFIFVSGSIGEDIAIEAMKNGAADYVLKDKLTRLAPAVLRALKEAEERMERKQAEEALRESEARFSKVFHNSPVGIVISRVDDGTFLEVNETFLKVYGYGREELIGHTSLELNQWVNPEDRSRMVGILREQGQVQNFEARFRRKSGEVCDLLISAELIELGSDRCLLAMFSDITEKRMLEAQLRHSQKMEAIGTLAGGIAHDFNNVLNVILGFGTLAQSNTKEGHPSREYLNEVLAAAERAATLTQRLLIFSRRQTADLRPVNVNDIVISLEKMLSRIIGEDIELVTELEGGELPTMADAGQLEQVLINLAANSRDAMPKGGRLTIGTGLKELDDEFIAAHGYGERGRYAFISVSDTGSGMDAETMGKMFEPFFTTKGVGEGTGLGLSIAYGIIKQHRGFINVYSETGKGTVFRILIPLIENVPGTAREAGAAALPCGGTETILVAEDDASLRRLSRVVLETFGYKVIMAEDGEDAIAKFMENRDRIDLVLLDMIMPKKNGREVYEEIKKISPEIKTLFMSGYTMDIINTRNIMEEGMDLILKPVSPKDLLNKIREVLDR